MSTSTTKSEFDLIYSQAVELTKAFPEYQFKSVTALLIIIGWLITSQGAQSFINMHASITLPGSIVAFALLLTMKFIWILGHQRRINRMHARLVTLAPSVHLPVTSLDALRLGPILPVTYLIVNVIMSVVVVVVVWLICGY
jgi:hypothetical protein